MNDDAISRRAAVDICNSAIDLWHGQLGEGALVAVKEGIEDLPATQPQRMRGKWSGPFCSKCGISKYNFVKILHTDDGPCGKWNFCPNCGSYNGGEE